MCSLPILSNVATNQSFSNLLQVIKTNSSMRRIHMVIAEVSGGKEIQANPTDMHFAPTTSHMVHPSTFSIGVVQFGQSLIPLFLLYARNALAPPKNSAQVKSPCRS